jgi:predicted dehydrogenase
VNSLPARPHRDTRPHDGANSVHRATNSTRSVILVGAGKRGLNAHLPALEACGHFRLTGIIDTKERIAQLEGIPGLAVPMHDTLGAVLAGPRPDFAIVATPHDSHVPLAGELLRARVPTLLEKPPARSAPELATLLQLSQELRTPLATSLPLHYRDHYQPFIRLLSSPGLSDAEVSIRASVPSWQGAGSWRLSRERSGGGVLIDLGYHYLELLIACLGLPDDNSVLLTSPAGTRCEVEGEALVSLWFAGRRLRVQLQLFSGAEAGKGSEMSVARQGELLYRSSEGSPAPVAPGRERELGPLPLAPAAAQLKALIMSGFLDGGGDWYQALCRQHMVMMLLDDLYAAAERMTCLPATGHRPDMTCPTDVTGLRERAPA